jgi:hypothetical protein
MEKDLGNFDEDENFDEYESIENEIFKDIEVQEDNIKVDDYRRTFTKMES